MFVKIGKDSSMESYICISIGQQQSQRYKSYTGIDHFGLISFVSSTPIVSVVQFLESAICMTHDELDERCRLMSRIDALFFMKTNIFDG